MLTEHTAARFVPPRSRTNLKTFGTQLFSRLQEKIVEAPVLGSRAELPVCLVGKAIIVSGSYF